VRNFDGGGHTEARVAYQRVCCFGCCRSSLAGQQKSESGLSGEADLAAAHQQVLADLSHSNGWGLRFQMVTAATTICVEKVVVCGLCVPVRPNYRGVQEPIANHGDRTPSPS
jgi:hypothetical protein